MRYVRGSKPEWIFLGLGVKAYVLLHVVESSLGASCLLRTLADRMSSRYLSCDLVDSFPECYKCGVAKGRTFVDLYMLKV